MTRDDSTISFECCNIRSIKGTRDKKKKHELSGQSGGRNGSGKKRINVSEGRIKSC